MFFKSISKWIKLLEKTGFVFFFFSSNVVKCLFFISSSDKGQDYKERIGKKKLWVPSTFAATGLCPMPDYYRVLLHSTTLSQSNPTFCLLHLLLLYFIITAISVTAQQLLLRQPNNSQAQNLLPWSTPTSTSTTTMFLRYTLRNPNPNPIILLIVRVSVIERIIFVVIVKASLVNMNISGAIMLIEMIEWVVIIVIVGRVWLAAKNA